MPKDIALINPLAALIAKGTTTSCARDTKLGCIWPRQIDPLRSLGDSLKSWRGDDLAVFDSLGVADMPDSYHKLSNEYVSFINQRDDSDISASINQSLNHSINQSISMSA